MAQLRKSSIGGLTLYGLTPGSPESVIRPEAALMPLSYAVWPPFGRICPKQIMEKLRGSPIHIFYSLEQYPATIPLSTTNFLTTAPTFPA